MASVKSDELAEVAKTVRLSLQFDMDKIALPHSANQTPNPPIKKTKRQVGIEHVPLTMTGFWRCPNCGPVLAGSNWRQISKTFTQAQNLNV
jgi:uncharacterized protein with PIN domain